MTTPDPATPEVTTPQAPSTQSPSTQSPSTRPDAKGRLPRRWLIAFAVLAVGLVVSAIVLVQVVRPPTYEPVPIPSVSST